MTDMVDYLDGELFPLLGVLNESDVTELELDDGETRIRLRRRILPRSTGQDGDAAVPLAGAAEPCPIVSPLVGTFYRAGQPSAPPLVAEGSQVEEGTVVGIVEALTVLTDVEAGCRGTIVEVRAVDGQPVEYGQVLFLVRSGD